ncbi:hypothetical protein CC86DRAFT_443164 [Ophiobolus disseminans]|uniref:Uncharacterized protein n=1 Tax=Ophiobolus disseminans TaxID=1469910 RepID=A0A6A7AE49_9PLEO|nr:hypothetical protein CC86DRAFT_443164 [Ophiobolus disseminans]
MAFPYQCLVARSETSPDSHSWILVGASGSKLVTQSSNGATSVWPQEESNVMDDHNDEQEPPGKRIKLSPPKEQKANFSSLVLSSDGKHLVGVTGEDKCIRVFQVGSGSCLQQLSERCMSRRPSSITLTDDDTTILCADKFGDVYALPLLPSPDEERPATPVVAEPAEEKVEGKEFTPSATVLTVHSGRNRKTLEEQLKKKAKGLLKTKEAITFKHDLLLGHVSMLTDLAYVRMHGRGYIITADRDEHIRISRGPPQAHIIEGFCFGHQEFISRLCLTKSGFLISGGGDAQLRVWDFLKFKLLATFPIRDTALAYLKARPELSPLGEDEANFKVAVSGIWAVRSSSDDVNEVLVACEGIPALFVFNLEPSSSGTCIPLQGNPLDVAFVQLSQGSWTAIVAIDNIHKPCSTTETRDDKDAPRLQHFSRPIPTGSQWHEDTSLREVLGSFAKEGSKLGVEGADAGATETSSPKSAGDKALRDILYNVENLRKRPGAED